MFGFSAPGESSPPLLRNTGGTRSNIRRDVVSEVRRDVADTQTVVYDIRNMLKGQQGVGGRPQSVSITHTLSPAEYTLTVA